MADISFNRDVYMFIPLLHLAFKKKLPLRGVSLMVIEFKSCMLPLRRNILPFSAVNTIWGILTVSSGLNRFVRERHLLRRLPSK